MNWKVFGLLPALILAAVPAYSYTNSNNQTDSSSVLVAQNKPSGAMEGESMQQPGGAMEGESMQQPSGAMMNSSTMMGMGSMGEEVKAAQMYLQQQGFYTGPLNGTYDEATRSAVIEFQNSKQIEPTGIIGPTTRGAMQ